MHWGAATLPTRPRHDDKTLYAERGKRAPPTDPAAALRNRPQRPGPGRGPLRARILEQEGEDEEKYTAARRRARRLLEPRLAEELRREVEGDREDEHSSGRHVLSARDLTDAAVGLVPRRRRAARLGDLRRARAHGVALEVLRRAGRLVLLLHLLHVRVGEFGVHRHGRLAADGSRRGREGEGLGRAHEREEGEETRHC